MRWLTALAGLVLAVPAAVGSPPAEPDGSSTARNPTVVFATPGAKSVTLTVCNSPR